MIAEGAGFAWGYARPGNKKKQPHLTGEKVKDEPSNTQALQ